MPVEPVNSIDLHLDLPSTGPRRTALAEALRDGIRTGRLVSGTRLPAYRALAADLGLARNVVADAYAELVAEGWLTARQGSGTRVADRARIAPEGAVGIDPTTVTRPLFDLRPGRPDPSSFPRTAWLASVRRAVNRAPTDAFGPGDPLGRIELRHELADYLTRARGVRTDARNVVVCSGFSQALWLLVPDVLGGPIAVESFGLPYHRGLLERQSPAVPLPVDAMGCVVEELDSTLSAAVLTPSHQFPTGSALHPERRAAVVAWAATNNGLVIEDDYDGEFRYDRDPIGALQALDPDRVLYIGSVSKSLSPSIRLGWMVIPERLVAAVAATKGEREPTAGVVDQLTLADFISCGAYDRHVRTMRLRYRRRRDQLVETLAARAPHLPITGIAAGLQAVLTLPSGTEVETLARASDIGLAIEGLSGFRHPGAIEPPVDGLVVGFSAPPEHTYPAALDALCRILPRPDPA